ncbi:uncharacterized protein [Nicotiana tomentosiformis]|uniref:uncharacterized protein n=1 Tax=Nicotiana tomentosiformis TaxID=4098 RepID=UPI00388C842B
MQLQDFWEGLTPASHRTLNNAVRGSLMKKTPEKIVIILDELSEDANQWPSKSAERRRSTGVHQVDANTSVQTYERMDAHGAAIKELGTGFRNLERQMRQIAKILSERAPGTLPADTERNSKEIVNVLKNGVDKKKKGPMKAEKKKKDKKLRREEHDESEHMPALPFPQTLYREKLDKQFGRFLDVLKQIHVNLPFIEMLSQMPAYPKFLKEILKKNRKIEETSVVKLTEHYIAILQNKLPQKKLEKEIGEIRSMPISLQLADQMTVIPEGIVEDILVRVDKFIFLVDFLVVNMEENKEPPPIQGRPFLATGKAILDIHERKLMLRVGEETVTFELNIANGAQKEKPAATVE